MSSENHKYNLHAGLFGLCSGYWDEQSDTFRASDDIEQEDCCLRTCRPFVNECVNECPNAIPKNRKFCY